uniref:Uncharacterized protein n=1 Tax=Rhizophora mucronata TaxID=61149 RepID=A0A2P2NBK7_RHIMU
MNRERGRGAGEQLTVEMKK